MKNLRFFYLAALAITVCSGQAFAGLLDDTYSAINNISGGRVGGLASGVSSQIGGLSTGVNSALQIGGAIANIGYTKIQNSIGTNINDMRQLTGTVAGIGRSALDYGINTGIGGINAGIGGINAGINAGIGGINSGIGVANYALGASYNAGKIVGGMAYGAGQWTRAQINNIPPSSLMAAGSRLSAQSVSASKIIPGAGSAVPRISPGLVAQRQAAARRENIISGVSKPFVIPRSH